MSSVMRQHTLDGSAEPSAVTVHSEAPSVAPTLPGKGEPGGDCGETVWRFCGDCNHSFSTTSKCLMRTCPNCWRSWAWKEARVSGLRMWSGSILVMGRRRGFRLLHCVVSFPAMDDLSEARIRVRKICKAHGISGGLTIFHPFRDQTNDGFVPDDYWHFHIIGLAENEVTPGTRTDYIFKVIKDARNKDYSGYKRCREIKATVFYLLTHAGIVRGRHALTWFGKLSYNMLSTEKLIDAYPYFARVLEERPGHRCPACGSEDTYVALDYTSWPPEGIG